MAKFTVTITNGRRRDRFCFSAANKKEAWQTAIASHLGTGWRVVDVSGEAKELSLKF